MTLSEIKTKRVLKAFGSKIPQPVQEDTDAAQIEEGKDKKAKGKKSRTPAFVKHCVTAITQDPERLAAIKAGGKDGEEGSPFAVCNSSYDKNTRSKAAAHSQGAHHSLTDYETALKKLREEHRQNSPDRSRVVFEMVSAANLKKQDRSRIVYRPRG